MTSLFTLLNTLGGVASAFAWLPPLLARLVLGYVFLTAGWGKLQNLEKVTAFFQSLNLPAAAIQAAFVSGLEFVGGILLLAGLATRLISIPLIVIMVVALLTAHKGEITDFSTFTGNSLVLYILLFIHLVVYGAGLLSLDALVARKVKKLS